MIKPSAVLAALALGVFVGAQRQPTDAEVAASNRIAALQSLPEEQRAKVTREIAFEIRKLPAGPPKVSLASTLTRLTARGDYGHGTLQAVADTLAVAVKEAPPVDKSAYIELASLARFEGIKVELTNGGYVSALSEVDALTETRKKASFSLSDRTGKPWTLSELKGKVVLVDFVTTSNEAGQREMASLDEMDTRFKDKGLVVLAITDESPETVDAYLKEHPVGYPVLLDPERKAATAYAVDRTPKSFVYNRQGKLVGQSLNARSRSGFLQMLSRTGLK